MKKIFTLCSAALCFVACTEKFSEEVIEPVNTEKIPFVGGFSDETKVAFTDPKDGVYPLIWTVNDAIGIFSYDMTTTANVNVKASLVKNSAGESNGVFIPVDEVIEDLEGGPSTVKTIEYPASGTEKFFIYYPYNSTTDISVDDGLVHNTLASVQSQDVTGDKKIGQNGFSCALVDVSAEAKKINFTLTHTLAYLRVIVSTTDYADAQLHSVQIYDAKDAAALAGDYTVDPTTATASVVSGKTSSSVKAVVANHNFTTKPANEVYLTILPGDYSAADLKTVVCFMTKDGKTISIPTTIPNLGNVPAGSMTTINVSANAADNKCAWYEPVESRDLIDMWAYGPQNTYFIESKPAGEGFTSLTIDVKARGDFSKVKEPRYYGWLCSCEMSTRKIMQLTDGTTAYESVPTHSIGSDYKVTVQCKEQGASDGRWAVLAIYDEKMDIIWSFMFIKYLTGDEPKDISYPSTDIVLLDRVLGAGYSPQYGEALTTPALDSGYAYFQWGRKDPFMWSNSGMTHYNQQLVTPSIDIAYAISHPTMLFGYTSGDGWNSNGNWYIEKDRLDLWGAVNTTDQDIDKNLRGHKTIYDPCPEGYRIPDGYVLSTVVSNGSWWESAQGQKDQDPARVVDTNPFKASASVLAYPLGNDKYDYWPYAGAHWGSNGNWGNRTSSNTNHACIYWGNSFRANHRACILEGCYFSSGWATSTNALAAQGFAVRCQKENK